MVASIGGLVNVRMRMSETSPSKAARSIGGGGITLETRWSSLSGRPMWKSASSGLATSRANQLPMDSPVMRRTISPMR